MADHGVRVVNISWTGGDSETLNAAGAYLVATDRGLLVMAGGNLHAAPYIMSNPQISTAAGPPISQSRGGNLTPTGRLVRKEFCRRFGPATDVQFFVDMRQMYPHSS